MADPKFANLPGIAYDQPDLFETVGPSPDTDAFDYYEEETENESIERLHISTKDSYNRFKGKYLTGTVDFSDRLGRKMRTGYDARSSDWELTAEGEKETPLQRCRRIQCEMNELLEEITVMQADSAVSAEDKASFEAVTVIVGSAKKVLDSLKLEQVFGIEMTTAASEAEVKKLVAQVDGFKKSGTLTPLQTVAATGNLAQSTRVAELEHRLHQLEKAIGAKPEKVSRLTCVMGTDSLLEAVQQLSIKAALLQPGQLELIEARLQALLTKMDAIGEKSSGTQQDSARDQKTLELFEIAKRTEPITQILPDMLQRMQALESLHKYASNFTQLFAELETTQSTITIGIANNKNLLQGVQDAFEKNSETINQKMAKLDERIKALAVSKK